MRNFFIGCLLFVAHVGWAMASQYTVTSPTPGEAHASPVWVRVHSTGCGHTTTWFGYSLDNAAPLIPAKTLADIDTMQAFTTGQHTIHVKAWYDGGECPSLAIPVTIPGASSAPPPPPPPPPPTTGPTIPSNATKITLDPLVWNTQKDAGTPGTACTGSLSCSTAYPVTVGGKEARAFSMKYEAEAGVRWSLTSATNDTTSTHFIYDTWVYAADWSQVANLEMDINQTVSGDTRILGTQCSGWDNAWDYTLDKEGESGGWHWVPSKVPCDPRKWSVNTWHHVQIVGHFDSSDTSYYDGVWFDGAYSALGGSGSTGDPLGWAKGHDIINLQIDGLNKGTGSTTVYASQITIYRW